MQVALWPPVKSGGALRCKKKSYYSAAIIPLIALLVAANLRLPGQSFNVILSAKHIEQIEKLKSPAKKLKKYKKYFSKDSVRFIKAWEKRLRKKPDSILAATQASIKQSEQTIQQSEQKLTDKIDGLLSRVNPWKVGANYLDVRVLALTFNPTPFKNEAEVFYSGHYVWRRDLGRWYLSSGYYKPDSTGLNTVGFPSLPASKFGLSKYTSASQPKMPQAMQEMPVIPGMSNSQINALKGKGKSQALSQLNGVQSLDEAKQIKGDVGKYSGELSKYKDQYGKYAQNPDSLKTLALRDGSTLAEQEMKSRMSTFGNMKDFKNYQKELSQVKGLQNQYKGQVDQLKDSAYLKKKAKEKAEEMAMTYLQGHPEIMNGVQKKMNSLMRKYSTVPNSSDLSTATKRSSLKGKSLTERLVVAANFQMISPKPLSLDLSPMLGYKINRFFAMGIGGLYRKTFTDSIPNLSPQIIGYKAFISHDVARNFFGYAEFGRNSPGLKTEEGRTFRIWKNAFIAGVGKKMLIHKNIEMTMLVGYNFFRQANDPVYPRPLVVRAGFQLSELALLKRKLNR
jgi:hypothetical protein